MLKSLLTLSIILVGNIVFGQENFVINGNINDNAKNYLTERAEKYRKDWSELYVGENYPNWYRPCVVNVNITRGNGGNTTFTFDKGEVFGFKMNVQGSWEGICDSVLPHEVMHTITSTYHRELLPRWADEGFCCYVEPVKFRPRDNLKTIWSFKYIMGLDDYPPDVTHFYNQSYCMVKWLIDEHHLDKSFDDRVKIFRDFISDYLTTEGDWPEYLNKHYGYSDYYQAEAAFKGAYQNAIR